MKRWTEIEHLRKSCASCLWNKCTAWIETQHAISLMNCHSNVILSTIFQVPSPCLMLTCHILDTFYYLSAPFEDDTKLVSSSTRILTIQMPEAHRTGQSLSKVSCSFNRRVAHRTLHLLMLGKFLWYLKSWIDPRSSWPSSSFRKHWNSLLTLFLQLSVFRWHGIVIVFHSFTCSTGCGMFCLYSSCAYREQKRLWSSRG